MPTFPLLRQTMNENKPANYENVDPYTFITTYLIPETKLNTKIMVCVKPDNPKTKGPWTPIPLSKDTVLPSTANLYVCISSCKKLDDPNSPHHGTYRTTTACAVQTHMFMLDDLGNNITPHKPDYEKLPIKPTWLIETSPNNYQALYVLTEPLDDIDFAKRIAKQLPGQAQSDKGAIGAVRWARLPGGVNNKPEYISAEDDKGFATRIASANPDLTYHVSQIIDAFQLELAQDDRLPTVIDLPDKPLQPLEGWDRHVSALIAIPPDVDYQTWFNIACVLHPWGEQGLAAWIEWSQSSTTHKLSEAELESKFNDVEYDIVDPKGHTNIVSWPWLQAKATDYGWDYNEYSAQQRDHLKTEIRKFKKPKQVEQLEEYCREIHDAFLVAEDNNYIIKQVAKQFTKLGTEISKAEIRTLINSPKKINPEDDCWTYPLTDKGNLERFHALYEGLYYFVPEMNKHLCWDTDRWVEDNTTQGVAINTIDHITKLERKPLTEAEIKALKKWFFFCGSYSRIGALTSLIRKDESLNRSQHNFNANPTKLGLPVQVLNLENNVVADNIPENFITQKTRFTYSNEEDCPRWKEFISEITDGNAELIKFLQILAGYSLFGENPEQAFVILNGSGANGKSTFANTLAYVMGDYSTTTSPTTLTKATFSRAAGAAAPDLIRLFQKRLVLCNEWEADTYLNESLIKAITGGSDPISVRTLYSNSYLVYTPSYLLMLATNHIPKIASLDHGIWRRLIIVQFDVNFDDPQHKTKKDVTLANYFRTWEGTGILNWMVEGYHMWREESLLDSVPKSLLEIKMQYKMDSDAIQQFINECCITYEPNSKITSSDLYRAYKAWTIDNSMMAKANRTFSTGILEKGYTRTRIGSVNGFKNIRLLTLSEKAEQYQQILNDERDDTEVTTRIN